MESIIERKRISGNYTVVDSGTILTFEKDAGIEIYLKFDSNPKSDLTIKMEFETDDSLERKTKRVSDEKERLITITFINYHDVIEFCSSSPIHIGTYCKKKLYLNLWINSDANNCFKKITYTLYKEL